MRLRGNGTTIVIRIKRRMRDRGVGITIVTFACATIVWFVGRTEMCILSGSKIKISFCI